MQMQMPLGSCQSHVGRLAGGKSLWPEEKINPRNRLALPLAMQSLRQLIGINQLNYEIFDKIATPLLGRRNWCGKTKLSRSGLGVSGFIASRF